jgi:hypothetical protein
MLDDDEDTYSRLRYVLLSTSADSKIQPKENTEYIELVIEPRPNRRTNRRPKLPKPTKYSTDATDFSIDQTKKFFSSPKKQLNIHANQFYIILLSLILLYLMKKLKLPKRKKKRLFQN